MQGWALKCYEHEVAALQRKEAKRVGYRRQCGGLDPERAREVNESLDSLPAGVAEGSEKLYNGLPALSLDGQALAVAITTHLGRPVIPPESSSTDTSPRSLRCGRPMFGPSDGHATRKDCGSPETGCGGWGGGGTPTGLLACDARWAA